MKFLSVRELRSQSARVWKELPAQGEMIVTSNGRPIAMLAALNEGNVEESLRAFRRSRAVDAVAAIQRKSLERGANKISAREIEGEIQAARKKRAK